MKGLRTLFHSFGASMSLAWSTTTAVLVAAVAGLVLWIGMEGSLAQSLRWVMPLLPADQTLQISDVKGSLWRGGQIGHVRWKRAELTIEAQDVALAWDWRAAVAAKLKLTQLHIKKLHIEDRSASKTEPIAEISLPVRVDTVFSVDLLELAGATDLRLEAVQGHYVFDGNTHVLEQAGLRMAYGSYLLDGQLQAGLPGALRLQVRGTVEAPMRLQQQAVRLDATADVSGTLYGPDAALDLALNLQPSGKAPAGPLGAMRARLQAQLRPAAVQPLESAQGEWSALDLATLWPQAPQTALSGKVQVQPDGAGWQAQVQLKNGLEGPLNHSRLPLQSADASVLYRDGQWLLQSLQAALAGGTVTAQGETDGSTQAWSAQSVLQGVEPARIDTRWRSPALDGKASAQQGAQGMGFDAVLKTVDSAKGSLRGTQLQAKGLWSAPMLVLDQLDLQTPEAQLTGQLQIDTGSYATRAELRARMPGADLQLAGSAALAQGQGSATWQVQDAAALQQWLAALPLVGDALQGMDAQGDLQLSADWNGGWQNQGKALQVKAVVQSKQFDLQGMHWRDFKLDASGTLSALALQTHAKLQLAEAHVTLDVQSQLAQISPTQWNARISSLQARVADGLQPKPWNVQLQQVLELDWQRSALLQSLRLSGGALQLSGPAPGDALLQWEPVTLSQASGAAPRWTSRGSLQSVPLAWLEAVGQTRLANLGLKGDLLLGGQWEASGSDTLQLRARVQRSSGDLQLLSGDGAGAVPAGLRDAHLALQIDGTAATAQMVWASDAGGNLQADFSTRLSPWGSAQRWAGDAPLQGSIKASLPKVGIWSVLAPVGWRISGTLEADAVLSGSRDTPLWKGSLAGRDMAIRSVVDGIDFSNGVMRLALDAQRMTIEEFRVQGAGGAAGGQLVATGSVDWLPGAADGALSQRLRMAVQAQAQALRLSARPDQRITVSGKLDAQLQDAKLTLRGALAADQALIVLPDETAPRLGADVTVRHGKQAASPSPTPEPRRRQDSKVALDVLVTMDPGRNFQLQGLGINTRLEGLLTVKVLGHSLTPSLSGELRAVNGTYRAYGQRLSIEQGSLRFSGAFDNPALDIRAVRPNLQQVVGVQINGTAQLPVVRLFAEPDLPEMEKLSWLVLGRSSANGGSEAAILQQAALALFAGNGASSRSTIVNDMGLDEVSLGQQAVTNLDGSAGSQATLKVGKRLSRDFYIAYERSLAGTLGTLYVFYDLSRRFTLRGESGATNAVDLIFTLRYD